MGSCAAPTVADPVDRNGFALRLLAVGQRMGGPSRGAPAWRTPVDQQRLLQNAVGDADLRDKPVALIVLGNSLTLEGRRDQAAERYAQALDGARKQGDRLAEAVALANIGVITAANGRYAEARQPFADALHRFEEVAARPVAPPGSTKTNDLLTQAARLGFPIPPGAAAQGAQQISDMAASLDQRYARAGALRTRLNLANLLGQLGQYAEAEAALRQAQASLSGEPGSDEQRLVLAEFAVLYRQSGRSADAEAFRARAAAAPPADKAATMLEGGLVAFGQGGTPGAATAPGVPGLPAARAEAEAQRPSHYAEAGMVRLRHQAEERERAGDAAGALEAYGREAMLAAVVAQPERERSALAQIERLHAAGASAGAAIFFGKRAVNLAQKLRAELGTMERSARQAYLTDKKKSYATLASLLMRADRLAEAEQVLRLLKEDEGQQFQAASAHDRTVRGTIVYADFEAGWLAKYDAIASRTRALESERRAMLERGSVAARTDARKDMEEQRRQQIRIVEVWLGNYETLPAKTQDRQRRVREIAAKPAPSRSAEERKFVAEYRAGMRFALDQTDTLGAGLRALKRDGADFLTPLGADEIARIDAVLARAAALRPALAALDIAVPGEPEPGPFAVPAYLSLFMDAGVGDSQKAWAIDRELEQLDRQRTQLDAEAAAALAQPRPAGERTFGTADAAALDAGRKLLAALPAGTVSVYYLIGEEALDILVGARDGRSRARVPLPRAELEARIRAFREVVRNPRADAAPAARALYESLIAPIEPALRDAGAKTLMLSLDGQLRYVPLAALHDGRGWLAERYALDLYTTAAPSALTAAPARRWRVAAFGNSAGGQGLSALPAVRRELEGVVSDPALGTKGVMPGVIRLDKTFSAAAMRTALREKNNVVHIASHFVFRPGDPSESFLLLGDGGRLTLAEMAAAEFRFDQVDLVTLSACETALSGADGFGQEVEGLGTLLQGQGAAAVLATLWSVADASTAQFMQTLYALREQRGLSRAESVRDAQLALLRGGAEAPGDLPARGATRPDARADARADPSRPYAHPYYWAPFVLMGNWL